MQQPVAACKGYILTAINQNSGNGMAEMYIPVMMGSIMAIIVRLAQGALFSFSISTIVLTINGNIKAAAKAAADEHPSERLEFMWLAAENAFSTMSCTVAKASRYVTAAPPRSDQPSTSSAAAAPRKAAAKDFWQGKEVCNNFLRGTCSRPDCKYAHPPEPWSYCCHACRFKVGPQWLPCFFSESHAQLGRDLHCVFL